jgi:hypothetical protein
MRRSWSAADQPWRSSDPESTAAPQSQTLLESAIVVMETNKRSYAALFRSLLSTISDLLNARWQLAGQLPDEQREELFDRIDKSNDGILMLAALLMAASEHVAEKRRSDAHSAVPLADGMELRIGDSGGSRRRTRQFCTASPHRSPVPRGGRTSLPMARRGGTTSCG